MILLTLALVLAIVWYFILSAAIGWLVHAWPCRDCLREKLRRGSRTHEAR